MKNLVLLFGLLVSTSLCFSAKAEDALILHVIKSPGISWASPRSLAKSTVRLRKHAYPIGHMSLEVRCGDRSIKSGMIQKYGSESTRIVKDRKHGLGVLFHDFKGFLQGTPAVNRGLTRMQSTGRLSVIKFLLSPESCERMLEFHSTFREQKMFTSYGFLSRPLHGEGGGCSAYSAAYAAVGGLHEPWMIQEWGRYHRVPRNWVGGPLTRYAIPVLKLLRNAPLRWARETEKGFPLFLYDPDRAFRWSKRMHQSPAGDVRPIPVTEELLGVKVSPRSKAFAVEIDRRHVMPPVERNYSLTRNDPRRAIRDPELLKTWWSEEIRILQEGQR